MLRYLNVQVGDIIDYSMNRVRDRSPFLIVGNPFARTYGSNLGSWNGGGTITYHDSASPIERQAYAKGGICDFILNNPADDFVWAYKDTPILYQDYKNLKEMYLDRCKAQVDSIINKLDYSKVKVDRRQEFFKGTKLFATEPLLALQVCLSTYQFDKWDINWGDPRTYYNGVKAICGLASSVGSVAAMV